MEGPFGCAGTHIIIFILRFADSHNFNISTALCQNLETLFCWMFRRNYKIIIIIIIIYNICKAHYSQINVL